MKKKIILGIAAAGTALAMIPMFAAFEAHVINVTAQIENALAVTTSAIDFGTVFPQEHLEKPLLIALSESFNLEDRVDDVEYFIRQKPKCGVTSSNGTVLDGPTWTGHVVPGVDDQTTPDIDESDTYTIDCEADRPDNVTPQPNDPDFYLLPSLCEYISKDGETRDDDDENDEVTSSFHKPFTVANGIIDWTDTAGVLTKANNDLEDNWIIDLSVPCFGNFCAQDWAAFVDQHDDPNNPANPNNYTQPIENEHKIFGCNLWVETSGISPNTNQCTDGEDNDNDGLIDENDPLSCTGPLDTTEEAVPGPT